MRGKIGKCRCGWDLLWEKHLGQTYLVCCNCRAREDDCCCESVNR